MLTFPKHVLEKLDKRPKAAPTKTRKNLDLIVQAVNYLYSRDHIIIQSRHVLDVLEACNLLKHWSIDANADDVYGINRAIGDCLGGHGLGLECLGKARGGNRYAIPTGGITEAYLKEKGITLPKTKYV